MSDAAFDKLSAGARSEDHADPMMDHLASLGVPTGRQPEGLLENEEVPNTDDTPTILSKNPPSPNGLESGIQDPLFQWQGRKLADYELMGPLGVGGMAAVLLARDEQLDRVVALKILPPNMATEPEMVQRFHQEARAAAKLDHENVARVYHYGEDQNLHFIAFEFVEGDNLRIVLDKRGPLPVEEAVHFMLQIAAGLAHAAARGVVHRDIKPSNIIITPTGRAKLVDMGLARTSELTENKDLTQSGVTLGTFEYISPEQALEPRKADVRSDIYSLGCTFYHVLTGKPPVPEGTAAKKLHHHQSVPPTDPRQLNANIPDNVAVILSKMMAKDPKDRYQSPEHLVQHLLQAAQQLGMGEQVPEGMLYVDAPLLNAPPRRPGLLIGLGLLGLLVLVLVLSFAPKGNEPNTFPAMLNIAQGPGDKANGKVTLPGPPPTSQHVEEFVDTDNVDDFRQLVENADRQHVRIQLTTGFTLTVPVNWDGGKNRTLHIKSKDPKRPVCIRLELAKGDLESLTESTGLLHLRGGDTTIEGVKFQLAVPHTPDIRVAGVMMDHGTLTATNCIFTQETPPEAFLKKQGSGVASLKIPIASVAVTTNPVNVSCKNCWFASGQTAVAVDGSAEIVYEQCAFGPHMALFHVRGQRKGAKPRMTLKHCSALLVHGPALRIDGNTGCEMAVEYSIFSGDSHTVRMDPRVLIFQKDSTKFLVSYHGTRNCYHKLEAFWGVWLGKAPPYNWKQFCSARVNNSVSPRLESTNLTEEKDNPWRIKPPSKTVSQQTVSPQRAFRLNPNMVELRERHEYETANNAFIGVHEFAGQPVYADKSPKLTKPKELVVKPPVPKTKIIVDGDGKDGHFTSLDGAIAEAADKAVVWIKQNGLVKVRPVVLSNKKDLTIKAVKGYEPILTLNSETPTKKETLFKLAGGRVTFENMSFLLKPDHKGFESQSIVTLFANGRCSFKNCRITLDVPDEYATELRVCTFPAAGVTNAMLNKDIAEQAQVSMSYCFVHGEGTMILQQQAVPFHLKIDNSLVALTGSFFHVVGTLADPPGKIKATFDLARTTTFLTNHLLHMVKENSKHVLPVEVKSAHCLFASAAGSDEPSLIHLEGLKTPQEFKVLVHWAGNHNAYCGYPAILTGKTLATQDAGPSINAETWRMSRETMGGDSGNSRFLPNVHLDPMRLRVELEPKDLLTPLEDVPPPDLNKKEDKLTKFGVPLTLLQSQHLPPMPEWQRRYRNTMKEMMPSGGVPE